MSESDSSRGHGRRARRLSPEEAAALEAKTGAEITGEMSPVPETRGAFPSPTADAPTPALRKFGRRARIIELTEDPQAEEQPVPPQSVPDPAPEEPAEAGESDAPDATAAGSDVPAGDGEQPQPDVEATGELPRHIDDTIAMGAADPTSTGALLLSEADDSFDEDSAEPGQASDPSAADDGDTGAPAAGEATPQAPAPQQQPVRRDPHEGLAPVIAADRDADGVELGELSAGQAPDPRPAPRFDGKVLHRSENSGGKGLVWLVWVLIAVALVVLVALLLTGILGPGADGALGALTALDTVSIPSSLDTAAAEVATT